MFGVSCVWNADGNVAVRAQYAAGLGALQARGLIDSGGASSTRRQSLPLCSVSCRCRCPAAQSRARCLWPVCVLFSQTHRASAQLLCLIREPVLPFPFPVAVRFPQVQCACLTLRSALDHCNCKVTESLPLPFRSPTLTHVLSSLSGGLPRVSGHGVLTRPGT